MRANGFPNASWETSSHVAIALRDELGELYFVQALPPEVLGHSFDCSSLLHFYELEGCGDL